MGNKQWIPIRAEGPHVGTDPVSVRPLTRQDEICYAANRPNWQRDADRHGVCPYMRANARVGSLLNRTRPIIILIKKEPGIKTCRALELIFMDSEGYFT